MLLVLSLGCSVFAGGTVDVCDQLATRTESECRDEVVSAMLDGTGPDDARVVPKPLSLHEQCEHFPERRTAVRECVEKSSCSDYASCVAVLGRDGFSPPSASPETSESACERWTSRKAGECRDEVLAATLNRPRADPEEKQVLLHPFTLRDQCELFGEREALVVGCVQKSTCEEFASCAIGIGAFYPPDSPNLCAAFVKRGGSEAVGQRCEVDAAVRERVAACMMVRDEEFAGCLVGLE